MKQTIFSLRNKLALIKRKACIFSVLFLFIANSYTNSQTLSEAFLFSSLSGTYSPTTGQTLLIGQSVDDQVTAAVNIGFTFNYDGQNFTQFIASTNGWLSFNTSITDSYLGNNLAAPTARPIIAPLWDDLEADNAGGGKYVNYALTGTAPNRVLTIEWHRHRWNFNSSDDVISFQCKLYETSNVIEFHYSQGGSAVNAGSASIGLTGTTSGFLSLNSSGTNPTVSSVTETNSIATKPATGQIYRWAPISGNLSLCSIGATSQLSVFGMLPNNITGGTITTSGGYKIHSFTTTGASTLTMPLGGTGVADVLVVAGGGGGGYRHAGGGGAGGYLFNQNISITGNQSITVGAGGLGATGTTAATNGGNSSFAAFTAIGGGFGSTNGQPANTGGSGGGGSNNIMGRVGTIGQGNNGGNQGCNTASFSVSGCTSILGGCSGVTACYPYGAGGGGAGAAAANGGGAGSAGGVGISNSITGAAVFYAGGGGGGRNDAAVGYAGGTGGGGLGGGNTTMNATNGTANTGGGGGGGGANGGASGNGGNGGSGIVIVRYSNPGTWASSNTAVATVNQNGLVTSVSNGVTRISYTTPSGAVISKLFVVKAIPAVPIVSAGSPSICNPGTTTLNANGMAPGGQVFQGNGTNAYINVVQNIMPEYNFTIEMWARTAASNTGLFCVTEADPPAVGGHDRHLYIFNGKLWVRVWTGAAWNTGYTFNDNAWHHVALVAETGVGQKVYVDGVLVGSFTYDHSDFNWDARFLIGYSEDLALNGLPANNWFNGSIDNVRIWSVARTQQQIIQNMHLEAATGTGLIAHYPLNGNANALVGPNGTAQGGTTWVVPTYYTYTWAGGPSLPAASTNESQTTGTISTNGTYNYTVTASAGSCPGNTSASVPVVVTSPVGNPAVFGTNVWNVYGYNGNSTTIASNTYRGNYIQPALGGGNEGIATQNFWGNGNSPSNAGTTLNNGNLWNGCLVNADNHTFVHKRRGFPCGTYTFTMNNWDDETRIIINGVNVWSCGVWSGNPGGYSNSTSATYSCVSGPTFTFQLDANSEVEIQVFEGAGLSNLGVDIIKVVPPSLAGNVSRMCPTSGSAFIDFTDATGRLIASVNPNSNNLGNVTITSYVGTPAVMNACAQPSNALFSTVYMGRTWVMTSSAYPSGTNFPSNVTVRLPYNNTELVALNTAADVSTTGNPNDGGATTPATLANLMLTKITGATENGVANAADCASTILGITTSPASGANYLSITNTSYKDFNVGQFSEFFLHKNNANMPLPVELISFSGTCTEKGTELTWQTASESNNDYFIVQRSRDGQNWEDLTTVSGNGNSTQLINYDWLDESGFGGMYYRLTQVDFNGDRYEKQAIYVNCESESTKLNVYPNPTQSDFTVEVNSTKEVESATISIIDVTGKALTHRNVEIHSGINTYNFGDQLESGTYLIRVSIEGEIQTLRLVVKN